MNLKRFRGFKSLSLRQKETTTRTSLFLFVYERTKPLEILGKNKWYTWMVVQGSQKRLKKICIFIDTDFVIMIQIDVLRHGYRLHSHEKGNE